MNVEIPKRMFVLFMQLSSNIYDTSSAENSFFRNIRSDFRTDLQMASFR